MGGFISGLFGIAGTALNAEYNRNQAIENNAMAAEREAKARQENYMYNEMAANNAYQRQVDYYNNFLSPGAKLDQLKAAGLSPSLAAGGNLAGASGISTPQGAGAAGVAPTTYGMPPIDLISGIKALAETRLTEAKADTEEGKNERGRAQIDEILADIGYKEAATAYTEMQTTWQKMQNEIVDLSFNEQVNMAKATLEKITAEKEKFKEETTNINWQNQLFEKTFGDKVNIVHEEFNKIVKEQLLMNKELALKDEQIKQISAAIDQEWTNLKLVQRGQNITQRGQNLDLKKFNAELNKKIEMFNLGIDTQKRIALVNAITDLAGSAVKLATAY